MTRERRLTVILVGVLAAVVIVGASAAFTLGRNHDIAGDGTTESGSLPPSSSGPSTGETTSTSAPPPLTTPGEVTSGAAGLDVTLSAEAQTSPHAEAVQGLLARYFAAINGHDYPAWKAAVTADQSANWSEDAWQRAYASTNDSNVYISDITDGTPMSVRIQFVSHQDVALAPTSLPVTCINWDVSYALEEAGGTFRVGTSTRDPYLVACR